MANFYFGKDIKISIEQSDGTLTEISSDVEILDIGPITDEKDTTGEKWYPIPAEYSFSFSFSVTSDFWDFVAAVFPAWKSQRMMSYVCKGFSRN